MKGKTVKLVLGVTVLAALIGVYAGVKSYVSSQEEKEAQEADTSVSFVNLEADDITSIAFQSSQGSEIVFEKRRFLDKKG